MRQQAERVPPGNGAARNGAAGPAEPETKSATGVGGLGAAKAGADGLPGAAAAGIADQRRDQMLSAALDVISERGFADTRIADIAERIGISPALVIYYFKTKDQLLTEAIRHYEDTWYAEGKLRMDALPTAAARLEEFVAMNLLPDRRPRDGEQLAALAGLLGPGGPQLRRGRTASQVRRTLARGNCLACALWSGSGGVR